MEPKRFYVWKREVQNPLLAKFFLCLDTAGPNSFRTVVSLLWRNAFHRAGEEFTLCYAISQSLLAPEHANGTVRAQEKLFGRSANTNQTYYFEENSIFWKNNKNTLRLSFPPSPCQSWKGSPVFERWFKGIFFLCFWPATLCDFYKMRSILNRKLRLSVLTLKINSCFIELHLQAWYTYEMHFPQPVMRL